MAITKTCSVDEWLAVNTGYCLRYRAKISVAGCQQNQSKSQGEIAGDCRCNSCGGLDNQPEAGLPQLRLVTCTPSLADDTAEPDPFSAALQTILEEEGAATEAESEEEAWVDEDTIDNEVLRLFPELREFFEERKPAEVCERGIGANSRQSRNKFAVYMGRCERCNGYMTNETERHDGVKDDDVYRCFTCGWRTSPVYQWNRHRLFK